MVCKMSPRLLNTEIDASWTTTIRWPSGEKDPLPHVTVPPAVVVMGWRFSPFGRTSQMVDK
jgi:hypothetical protein